MQATAKDIESLAKLQEIDMVAANASRQLQRLPERAQLKQIAEKRTAIAAKLDQVVKMHDAAAHEVAQINGEAEILKNRQDETQKRIDETGGDYRRIESLTKDLSGMQKRLEKLGIDKAAAEEKLTQVKGVKKQIEDGLALLDAKYRELSGTLHKKTDSLNGKIEEAQAEHAKMAAQISPELVKIYMGALKHCGGVAMCKLEENRCSACHSTIEPNRLLQLKKEAPITECPQCHRMMLVD